MRIELEDFTGQKFTEGDTVLFADAHMSLRIAKVRGIKDIGNGAFMVALSITDGLDTGKRNYSRRYFPHDFYRMES